jgi:hypothetical protein
MTASNSSERIAEINTWLTAYQTEANATSDLKTKNDCADLMQKLIDEKNRLSGVNTGFGPTSGFPQPK